METKKPTTTTVKSMRLTNDTISRVERMAQDQNRNFTNMVETILRNATSSKTVTMKA